MEDVLQILHEKGSKFWEFMDRHVENLSDSVVCTICCFGTAIDFMSC